MPSLDEICQEIKEPSLKKKALIYLAYFMAASDQNEKNLQFINDVANKLMIDEETVGLVMKYYNSVKAQNEIKNTISNNN